MSIEQELLALANEAAAVGPDMTEATQGGGERRLLPAGYAFGRLIEVIELGVQVPEYGINKTPVPMMQLAFALWGTDVTTGENYHNDDGTPYIERLLPISLSRNEKANAFKLFAKLNWRGTRTHFGQLLNEAFLVKVHHVAKSKADKTIVSRIDLAGFLPPLDAISKQPYAVPAADPALFKLFLWDKPTKGTWDSLFIDGQWEAKPAEGDKPARAAASKNKLQEKILGANNFQGSPLDLMLKDGGIALPDLSIQAQPTAAAAVPAVASVVAATVPSVTVAAVPAVASVPQVAVPLAVSGVAAAAPQTAPVSTATTSPTEGAVPLVVAQAVASPAVTPAIATVAVPQVVVHSSPAVVLPA